jgi:hypothetical protein
MADLVVVALEVVIIATEHREQMVSVEAVVATLVFLLGILRDLAVVVL